MKQILYTILFLIATLNAQAQRGLLNRVVDRAIDKTSQKVEDRMNRKIDTLVDKSLDNIDNKSSTSTKTSKDRQNVASNNSAFENIEPFPQMSMVMQMEFPAKSKDNMTMGYFFKDYECAFEMKASNGSHSMDRMIMNFKERKSTILMTDEKGAKTGIVIDLKMIDAIGSKVKNRQHDDADVPVDSDFNIKETNEYKTIEGYKCRKYIHETDDYTQDIWITKDLKLDYSKISLAMASSFANSKSKMQTSNFNNSMGGMMIQTHMKPKTKKGEESIMTIKDIAMGSVSSSKFSTDGYAITKMPSLGELFKR